MKIFLKSLPFIILILCVSTGCKNVSNLIASKSCSVDGVPDPKTSNDFLLRASKHMEKRNFTQEFNQCAYQDFDQAVQLDDKNAQAYTGRGLMQFYAKKMDEAKADFDKAVQLDANYSMAYLYRGMWYKEKKDYDHAIAEMDKTIAIAPAESDYDLRAQLYELKNDYARAAEDYTHAIEVSKDKSTYRNDKEVSYYQLRAAAYRKLGKEDLAKHDDEALKSQYKNVGITQDGDPATVGGSLKDKAIELPAPAYPSTARAVHASGMVTVAVEVAADGTITKAEARSGHPLLRAAAVEAAKKAKFKPASAPYSGSLEYEFKAQ